MKIICLGSGWLCVLLFFRFLEFQNLQLKTCLFGFGIKKFYRGTSTMLFVILEGLSIVAIISDGS